MGPSTVGIWPKVVFLDQNLYYLSFLLDSSKWDFGGFHKRVTGTEAGGSAFPISIQCFYETFSKMMAKAEEFDCINGCRVDQDGPTVLL